MVFKIEQRVLFSWDKLVENYERNNIINLWKDLAYFSSKYHPNKSFKYTVEQIICCTLFIQIHHIY